MADYNTVCKQVYEAFIRSGGGGIGGAGETDLVWVFCYAPQKPDVVEYNCKPIIVDKKTGESKTLNFMDAGDRDIYYTAEKIDVPNEYMAPYIK